MLVAWLTSGLAWVGWAMLWPVPLPSPSPSSGALQKSNVSAITSLGSDSPAELEWSQRLNERRLQGWSIAPAPLELDSMAAAPMQAVAAEPLAGLVLTGTIVEPGKSFAMFSDRLGATDLKPVGGWLRLEPAGIRIDSIVARRVVVSFEGLTHEIELTQSTSGPSSGTTTEFEATSRSTLELEPWGANALEMQADPSLGDPPPAELSPLEAELDWLNGSESGAEMGSSNPNPANTPVMNSQMGVGT
jgi:hypothetical protein